MSPFFIFFLDLFLVNISLFLFIDFRSSTSYENKKYKKTTSFINFLTINKNLEKKMRKNKKRVKILIVSGHKDILEEFKKLFKEDKGFYIIPVLISDREEIFSLIEQEVDVVVVDEILEKDTPTDKSLLYDIKNRYSLPVVYICYEDSDEEIKQLALFNYGYIVFPFNREYVLNTLYLAIQKSNLEKELDHKNKLKTLVIFAGGIAHDFNNLLGAIIGYSELLKFKTKKDAELTRYVDLILKASNRAKNLVELLTNFSRNWSRLKKQRFPFHIILKETIRSLQSEFPPTIEIVEDINKEGNEIYADPTNIYLLCLYLIKISRQLLDSSGKIKVSLKRDVFSKKTRSLDEHLRLSMEIKSKNKIEDNYIQEMQNEIHSFKISEIVEELSGILNIEKQDEQSVFIELFIPID